jgi:hypothetical protein
MLFSGTFKKYESARLIAASICHGIVFVNQMTNTMELAPPAMNTARRIAMNTQVRNLIISVSVYPSTARKTHHDDYRDDNYENYLSFFSCSHFSLHWWNYETRSL